MGRFWYSPCLCFMMLLLLLIFLAKAPATQSWGTAGHHITCKIAQPLLNEAAAKAVQKLLPSSAEGDLASICLWADTVRSIYPWSYCLHFANPPGVCNYDYTRDCHNDKGEKDMCVTGAINNFTAQLATYGDFSTTVTYNLTESLMFLSHLIGDIHQPQHLGFINDLGGNRLPVQWYTQQTNLHKVWDLEIIEQALKEFYGLEVSAMIEDLQRNITGDGQMMSPHGRAVPTTPCLVLTAMHLRVSEWLVNGHIKALLQELFWEKSIISLGFQLWKRDLHKEV